jgi:tRNA pseudouridine55 synthase
MMMRMIRKPTTRKPVVMTMPDAGVPLITRSTLAELPNAEELHSVGALLLVDKPMGWTSFDVVAKARRLLGVKKIGHAGTLDPMATGLLVLCIGRATKLADTVQAGIKEYVGTMRFGATTPTDDAESEENEQFPVDHLSEELIREKAATFIGESMQIPPMFSARKVAGQRLYKIARKGGHVEAPAKPVTIFEFEITNVDLPEMGFRIVCSKGTYIRSIARDLGHVAGSGAYLTSLRRTRSGDFLIDDAVTIQQLIELRSSTAAADSQ